MTYITVNFFDFTFQTDFRQLRPPPASALRVFSSIGHEREEEKRAELRGQEGKRRSPRLYD